MMNLCWPRRSPGLPPGQRLLEEMPRFTNRPFEPPPLGQAISLTISVEGQERCRVDGAALSELGLRTYRADFHCVATWSVTDLTWTGVALHEVLAFAGLDEGAGKYLIARAADRRRGHFLTCDALAPDVILATQLNGRALGPRHGGPVRLVAPQHYGYKSIKHLTGIDLRDAPPCQLGKEHLRGRVANEERHPTLPCWMVRGAYRLLVPATAYFAERSLR